MTSARASDSAALASSAARSSIALSRSSAIARSWLPREAATPSSSSALYGTSR